MIDWFGFVIVGLTTLIGAGFVVGMYSLGVRFTAFSGDDGAASIRRPNGLPTFALASALWP